MQNRYRDIYKSIIKKIDIVIVCFVLLLICAHPLTIDLRLIKPSGLCKLVLFYGTTIFIITCWLIKLVFVSFKQNTAYLTIISRKSYFQHTPLTYPVIAYIMAVLLSTIFSANKTISIFGYYTHYEGLLTSLGYTIIFFAILTYFRRQHIFYLVTAVSVAGFLSSLYGIIQYLNCDPIPWEDTTDRFKIVSTLGNPVFFSGYIVSVFPLILAGFLSSLVPDGNVTKKTFLKKCFLIFLFIVMVLMIFNLYATKTRGAWLGFIFSMLCLVVLLFLDIITKHKIKSIIITASIAAIFVMLISYEYKNPINQLLYLLKHKGNVAEVLTDESRHDPEDRSFLLSNIRGQSILYRIVQYKSALDIIRDYPITGIGPDALPTLLPRYAFTYYRQTAFTPEFENVAGIHNDILDKATTSGILGLGSYVWVLVTFILFMKRHFNRTDGRNNRLILSGFLACLVGYLVQQQFNVTQHTLTLHFWVFLAAGIVLTNPEKDQSTDLPIRGKTKKKTFPRKASVKKIYHTIPAFSSYICYLLIGGALIYSLSFLINLYKADVLQKKGLVNLIMAKRPYETGENHPKNPFWEKGLEYYKASIAYNPRQIFYRYPLCDAYFFMLKTDPDNTGLMLQIIRECEEIIKINPYEDLAFYYLGNAYSLLEAAANKDYGNQIISYYEKAISINPHKNIYYDHLGTYYVKRGFYDKAIPLFKQILNTKPDYPQIAEKLTSAYKPLIAMLITKDHVHEAETLLNEIQSMPHNNDVYFKKLKTLIYGKKGMWDDVIRESEQILSLKPDDIDAYQNIATAYYAMGKYNDAKKTLEKIFQLSLNFQPAHDLFQKINAIMDQDVSQ